MAADVIVVAGMLCHDGRVLLGKRAASRRAYPGAWGLPGGHVEPGETLERALVRELAEELGVTATAWRELAVLRAPATGDESGRMLGLHVFLVTEWRGEPANLLPEEHDEIGWFTLQGAGTLALAYDDYPALFRDVLAAT